MKKIGIVGAGLMGRLSALSLHRKGHKVTLFDKDDKKGEMSAARAAAGLLTPLGESLSCDPWIVQMGFASLSQWPELLKGLDKWVFFQQAGSVVVAHEQDTGDMMRFSRNLSSNWPQYTCQVMDRQQLQQLEPELGRGFVQGYYLPQEGQIGSRLLLKALYIAPKPNHHYVVGATEIESDDDSPMTVRSALELLSAAYSVHPGFAEATIREHVSQCRPAFNDNHPQIRLSNSVIQVNGLYRHGFLLAPMVLDHLLKIIDRIDGAPADEGCDAYLNQFAEGLQFSQLVGLKQ